jgi:signal peptidase I
MLSRSIRCAAAALAIIAVIGGIWLYVCHVRLVRVQSDSMRPVFERGDVLVIVSTAPESMRVGDVVSYRSLQNQDVIVTHRLVGLRHDGQIQTAGDARGSLDTLVAHSQIVGRAILVVPGAGAWLDRINSPAGLVVAVYIPATAVLVAELWPYLRAGRYGYYRLSVLD